MNPSRFFAALLAILFAAARLFGQQASVATIVTLNDTGGGDPYAGMTLGSDGNLYGTTSIGGTNFYGAIFELSSNNTFTTLVNFAGTNGSFCPAPMTLASNGNLYGVTYVGGTKGAGSIFEFTTNYSLISLVSLNGTNGANPWGALVQASDGNFYGTTSTGGPGFSNGFGGSGTIFLMKPDGTFSNLYNFTGGNDGSIPYGALVEATNHILYGTTYGGGSGGGGVIFGWSLDPGESTEMPLGGNLGSAPGIGLVLGCNGLLLTATSIGGSGGGGVFLEYDFVHNEVTPLHFFSGVGSDGEEPFGPIVIKDRAAYGTTYGGGLYDFGTIYKLAFDKDQYNFSTVYSFHDEIDGGYPKSSLSISRFGSLYTTTLEGSTTYGAIDEIITPPRLGRLSLGNGVFSAQCFDALPGFTHQPIYSWTVPGTWENWGSPITPTSGEFPVAGTVTGPQGFLQITLSSPYPVTH